MEITTWKELRIKKNVESRMGKEKFEVNLSNISQTVTLIKLQA
jgi:hypothetical protein